MPYDQNKYREHQAEIRTMQRDVQDRLAPIGYPVVISDFEPPRKPDSPDPTTSDSQIFAEYPVIRVNLLEGIATVEHDLRMLRQHEILDEMGIPHDYAPPVDHTEKGPQPSSIRLSLVDALQGLPAAFAKARAETSRKLYGNEGDRQI